MFWPKTLPHTPYGRLPAASATPESGVRRHWRPGFHAKLSAPDQIPSAPGIRSMRSNPCLWQRLRRLLWVAVECRGRRPKVPGRFVREYKPVPVYHVFTLKG